MQGVKEFAQILVQFELRQHSQHIHFVSPWVPCLWVSRGVIENQLYMYHYYHIIVQKITKVVCQE